jgi:phosphomannomutase/phosphoglucomutase
MQVNPYVFREYDVRGVVGVDLTPEFARLLGKAYAVLLLDRDGKTCAIGEDVRHSSPELADAFADGARSQGVDVVRLGRVLTPAAYFALTTLPTDGACMVTGSHNPPEFNGFKMNVGALSIHGADISELRRIIEEDRFLSDVECGDETEQDVLPDYLSALTKDIRLARPLKVVCDSGNGAAGLVAPASLRAIGAEVIELFTEPDGSFPNHHPDPTVPKYMSAMLEKVKVAGADIGVGFDGDADRLGACDENGRLLFGDTLVALFAREVLKAGPATIVFDVKCSQAVPEVIRQSGGVPLMYKTGHSLLKAKRAEVGAPFAGEMSGHLFFADEWYGFDDAVYAALRLCRLVADGGRSLSALVDELPTYYSSPEVRAECPSDQEKFAIAKKAAAYFSARYAVNDIDGVRVEFDDGWALVRPSNTQPVIVLRFEAKTPERLAEITEEVTGVLRSLGEVKI